MILNSIFSKIIKVYKESSKDSQTSAEKKTQARHENVDSKASSDAIRNNFIGQNNVQIKPLIDSKEAERRIKIINRVNELRRENSAEEFIDIDKADLLELDSEQFKKAKDLFFIKSREEFQFSVDEINFFLQLEDKQFEKAKALFPVKEILSYGILDFVKELNDKEFETAIKLIHEQNEKFSIDDIFKLSKMPKDIIAKIKNLPDFNYTPYYEKFSYMQRLSKLSQENIEKVQKLNKDMPLGYAIYLYENISEIPFKERENVIQHIRIILDDVKDPILKKELEEKMEIFKKSLNSITEPIKISKENETEFWNNFLVTENKNNLETIKKLSPVVEKYGQTGLPLEYSRKEFINDLNSKLSKLPQEQKEAILRKLDIKLDKENYEGFINLNELDKNNPDENEIQKFCEKFLLNNKISTGDEKTDKFLNSIIKGVPEFVNIIGKKQHPTHKYTLDLHTMKVMQEFVSNPKFEILSDKDKKAAQLMVLFHDIGKKGNVIDSGHEFTSAIVANDIMQKFNMPEFEKKRVVELVKNHNWLQKTGRKEIDIDTAAVMFRAPGDIEIAEIFAESDLKGVGGNFYELYGNLIKPTIKEIKEKLNKFYSTGNMIFQTKLLAPEKIPEVEYKGHKYRVLDITKTTLEDDLREYGLSVKSKGNLRFLYHMGNLEKLETLLKPFNEAHLCTSLISPYKRMTYGYEPDKVGVMLDTINYNIVAAYPEDQSSEFEKDFKHFVEESMYCTSKRRFQSSKFIEKLSEKYSISKEDYSQIYKQLADKNSFDEIKDIKLPSGKKIKAKDLIDAYKTTEDALLKNAHIRRNEITVYNPQIKGLVLMGYSMDEINEKELAFVRKHNLPIFIMGNRVY